MKEMLNAIELNHVTKEFKNTTVLQDITLALGGRTLRYRRAERQRQKACC